MPICRLTTPLATTSVVALLFSAVLGQTAAMAEEPRTIDRIRAAQIDGPGQRRPDRGPYICANGCLPSVARGCGSRTRPRVVLFIHGGFSPAAVAYDLDYKDYSWMAYLARAGFRRVRDDHTAYGASPKPMMDDPCNVDPAAAELLIPHVLKEPCAPRYPFKLVSSQTEWDEVEPRRRIHPRTARRRQGEHDRLVDRHPAHRRLCREASRARSNASCSSRLRRSSMPTMPPATFPEPGAPMILQTRDRLEKERWLADVQMRRPDRRRQRTRRHVEGAHGRGRHRARTGCRAASCARPTA